MYLPLTGFDKNYDKKRGVKMEIGSVGASTVSPPTQAQPAGTQQQEVKPQNEEQKAQNNIVEPPTEKFKSHYAKNDMSTEDFLSLRDTGTSQMMETVKDVMALKLLEKAIEAITKIASD